jgi:S1/P1 Nuclease
LLTQPEPVGAANIDVTSWSKLSVELAKQFVYASPINAGSNPQIELSPRPDAAYDTQAHKIARQQILLAGYRLAYLLNENLK